MLKMNCRKAAILLLLLWTTLAFASEKPITYEGLLKALKIGGLSTGELIDQVHHRGVDFVLTPNRESELKGAGAQPELLLAIRAAFPQSSQPAQSYPPQQQTPQHRPPSPPTSQVRLGVKANILTPEQARRIKYQGGGIIILSIEPGSLAAQMLMRTYDVLNSVNNVPVQNPEQLISLMSQMRPGQEVACRVMRGRAGFAGRMIWEEKLLSTHVPGSF